MPPVSSPPLRKRRKEARPSELTAAALDLFVEKGYAATRLEDVAERAGVSKGTLYLYFDSKEALFKAVIREGLLPILSEGEAISDRHTGSAFELLERLLRRWWATVGETTYAGLPKLMVAEARNFPEVGRFYYENVIVRARALVGGVLAKGMASGEFRSLDIPACIDVIIAPIMMLIIWRHSLACCLDHQPVPGDLIDLQLTLLRQGLQAPQV